MAGSRECLRITLWMTFVAQWLFNLIYVALALASFAQLTQASNAVVASGGTALIVDRSWRAPLATCILSSLLVIGFDLMSCITLIKKSINRAGPGFGYGFIVAYAFCLSFFMLLCGLVLDCFRPKLASLSKDINWTAFNTSNTSFKWNHYDHTTVIGAEVFALINFVTFLLFAIVLVVLQAGVSEQLGIENSGGAYSAVNTQPQVAAAFPGGEEHGTSGYGGYGNQTRGYEEQNATDGYHHTQLPLAGGYAAASSVGDYPDYPSPAPTENMNLNGMGGGMPLYGHAAYGQTNDYAFDSNQEQQQVAGSGLLGGQIIGTTPTNLGAPPPYGNYGSAV